MGQYHKVVNLDKKQYLHPHRLGDGIKLLEFGCGGRTMTALAVLLSNSTGRGGGDLHSLNPIVGSWAGDRIVIAGDYAEPTDRGELGAESLYSLCRENEPSSDEPFTEFTDISNDVLLALCDDSYLAQEIKSELEPVTHGKWSFLADASPEVFAKVGLVKPQPATV